MTPDTTPQHLPVTGYLRQVQIIGRKGISEAQAAANRRNGAGARRPRVALPALVPWSSATFWRKVKAGEFPAPAKLSENVTAWSVESVRAWLASKAA